MYNVGSKKREWSEPANTDVPYDSVIYIGTIMKNGRRYIYLRGNLALEYLNGLTPASQSDLINEIFSQVQAKFLTAVVDYRSKSGKNFVYLRKIEEENNSGIPENISFRIHSSQLHWVEVYFKEGEISSERYDMEYDEELDGQDTVIIDKSGDTYFVEDYSDGVGKLLKQKQKQKNNSHSEEFLNGKIQSALLRQFFDACLKENVPISCYFTPPEMEHTKLKVTLFPFSNTRSKRIFIYFRYMKKISSFFERNLEKDRIDKNNIEQKKEKYLNISNKKQLKEDKKYTFADKKCSEENEKQSLKREKSFFEEKQSLEEKRQVLEQEKQLFEEKKRLLEEKKLLLEEKKKFLEEKKQTLEKLRKEQLFAIMTPREKLVAEKVLCGISNKEISIDLDVKEGTIKKLVYNIYQKLGINTRVQFIKKFLGEDEL